MQPSERFPFRPTGAGLIERPVFVKRERVDLLRAVVEAHDGLAFTYGDGSGVVWLLAPSSQQAALDRLIADLDAEGLVAALPSDRA